MRNLRELIIELALAGHEYTDSEREQWKREFFDVIGDDGDGQYVNNQVDAIFEEIRHACSIAMKLRLIFARLTQYLGATENELRSVFRDEDANAPPTAVSISAPTTKTLH